MSEEPKLSEPPNTGPNRANMLAALGMVKKQIGEMKALAAVNGHIAGKRTAAKDMKPSKFCPACNRLHSPSGIVLDDSLKAKACDACQALFDQGMACIVSKDRRYAFVFGVEVTAKDIYENGGYAIIAGVSPEVMDAVEKRFKAQRQNEAENPPDTRTE